MDNSFPSTACMLLKLLPKIFIIAFCFYLNKNIDEVIAFSKIFVVYSMCSSALEDLRARVPQSIVHPAQLLVYFAGILALTIATLVSCLYYSACSKTLPLYLPAEHHCAYTIVCPHAIEQTTRTRNYYAICSGLTPYEPWDMLVAST